MLEVWSFGGLSEIMKTLHRRFPPLSAWLFGKRNGANLPDNLQILKMRVPFKVKYCTGVEFSFEHHTINRSSSVSEHFDTRHD